jgi:hypothetical protein
MSDFGTNPPTPQASYPANNVPAGVPMPAYGGSAMPSPDERTMAMLAELLQLFSSFIGPLIIFLVKRDSAFVRFHALQAMLWHIVTAMLSIVGVVAFIAMAVASSKFGTDHSPVPMLFIFGIWALFGAIGVTNIVVAIYFAIKANNGVWASYPVIGHIARGLLGLPRQA